MMEEKKKGEFEGLKKKDSKNVRRAIVRKTASDERSPDPVSFAPPAAGHGGTNVESRAWQACQGKANATPAPAPTDSPAEERSPRSRGDKAPSCRRPRRCRRGRWDRSFRERLHHNERCRMDRNGSVIFASRFRAESVRNCCCARPRRRREVGVK